MIEQYLQLFSSRAILVAISVMAMVGSVMLHDTHLDKLTLVATASYAGLAKDKISSDAHTHAERISLRNMLERTPRVLSQPSDRKHAAKESDRLKKKYHFPDANL